MGELRRLLAVGCGVQEDPAIPRNAQAPGPLDRADDHRRSHVDDHVRAESLRVGPGDHAVVRRLVPDRLDARRLTGPGVGVAFRDAREAVPEPGDAVAIRREALAGGVSSRVLVEREHRGRLGDADVELLGQDRLAPVVEVAIGRRGLPLVPAELPAGPLGAALGPLGLTAHDEHGVPPAGHDLARGVGHHALNAVAADRRDRRLGRRGPQRVAQQPGRIRIGPEPARNPDRVELREQRGTAGVLGGAPRGGLHQHHGLLGLVERIGVVGEALQDLAGSDQDGCAGIDRHRETSSRTSRRRGAAERSRGPGSGTRADEGRGECSPSTRAEARAGR